jgi:hypothetical protein
LNKDLPPSVAPIAAAILFLAAFEAKKDSSEKRETNVEKSPLAHASKILHPATLHRRP